MTRAKATAPKLPKTPPPTPTNPKTKTKKAMLSPQTAAKVRRRAKSSPAKAKPFAATIQKTYVPIPQNTRIRLVSFHWTDESDSFGSLHCFVPHGFVLTFVPRRKNQGIGLRNSASRLAIPSIPRKLIKILTSRRRGMGRRRLRRRKELLNPVAKLNFARQSWRRGARTTGARRRKVKMCQKARKRSGLVDMYQIQATNYRTKIAVIRLVPNSCSVDTVTCWQSWLLRRAIGVWRRAPPSYCLLYVGHTPRTHERAPQGSMLRTQRNTQFSVFNGS